MLNVDVDYLIVRLETALDVVKEIRKTITEQVTASSENEDGTKT